MKLSTRKFGRTGCRVSTLCLSTSHFARYTDQEESFAMLDAFRAVGGNFVQTSGICPGVSLGDGFLGMPEELLGRWLKQRKIRRESIVIATRFALSRPIIGGLGTYKELIRSCAADSIRRIGCHYLDFLVVEWTDAILPVAESIAAFDAVIASGEIRHIVPASFPPWRVIEALGATYSGAGTIAGLQLDYSLAVRSAFDPSAAKLSADYGLGVIARSPLAGGHLASRRLTLSSGALRHRGPGDHHAAMAADALWPALSATARSHRHSRAQIAVSWVANHPQVTSVLVNVSSIDQLRELCAATRLQLSSDDIARLGGRRALPRNQALARSTALAS